MQSTVCVSAWVCAWEQADERVLLLFRETRAETHSHHALAVSAKHALPHTERSETGGTT